MDESWRIPIGSVVPRRRSTEQVRRPGGIGGLDPDDFRDVFGGPPRTVLLRQFSGGDLTSPSSSTTSSYFDRLHRYHQPGPSRRQPSFYEEVFRRQQPPELLASRDRKLGRRLPDFTIPSPAAASGGGSWRRTDEEEEESGYYGGDISERQSRTRSRQSKSNSSSVLSWEDPEDGGEPPAGPLLRQWLPDDAVLTSFASKLRPIAVRSRRCDAPSPTSPEEQISSRRTCSTTVPRPRRSLIDLRFEDGVVAADDDDDSDDDSSPSSVISSIYDIPMATLVPVWGSGEIAPQVLEKVVVVEEKDEEAEGSHVIEMMPGGGAAETEGSAAVDEAIAWAKEKSRASSLPHESHTGVQEQRGLLGTGVEGLQDVVYDLEKLRNGISDVSTAELRT